MPKERESELRHLGGKAIEAMHSNCIKKMPINRQKEASDFDVLFDLKNLSDKSDKLAEEKLPEDLGLSGWFEDVRKTLESIRDCKSIKDINYPPSIVTFFDAKDKDEKLMSPSVEVTPVLKITQSVTSNTQMVTPSTSVRKKVNPFVLLHQLSAKEISVHSNENSLKKDVKSESVKQTSVLNRTYDKVNQTIVLDSGSARDKKAATPNGSSSVTRSGSRTKKENDCPNSHGVVTRSGSKRKSSTTRNKSNKKQKVDSINISSATLNKTTAQQRRPLRDLKTAVLASENKNKLSSVVKPTPAPKQSVVTKEQKTLEEIQRKEKQVEENMKRLKAERQQKAEQNKKAREEKRKQNLQKRLQMEKEKEQKREVEGKKSQAKVNKENPKKTTRAKELIEQHKKESKSITVSSTAQSSSCTSSAEGLKTPVQARRKTEDIESYELTPVPDSSTYNFSDDEEEERPTRKPIPAWAQGVLLKSALMQQYYYPVNTEEIFGSVIETPNLVEIFKINKKRYMKRTSSAIWNSPPDRSYHL